MTFITDAEVQSYKSKGSPLSHLSNLDANEQVFFLRELEHIKAKTYDVLKTELKARTLIPVSREAPAGAETITYYQYDRVGQAKLISNYADDLPIANIKGQMFQNPVKSIGAAFIYSLQDLRASMMVNKSLPQREANAAARAIGEREELLAAFGDSTAGLNGLLNHPNIPRITAANPGGGTRWIADSKTADQIIADMSTSVQTILDSTLEVEKPDTILLPPLQYGLISSTRVTNINTTILGFFLATNPWIKTVGTWIRLKTADQAGTGPRMLTYSRNPDKLTLEIPQDFEILPVQQENLSFKTPCHERFGGVIVYYPLSAIYMDSI